MMINKYVWLYDESGRQPIPPDVSVLLLWKFAVAVTLFLFCVDMHVLLLFAFDALQSAVASRKTCRTLITSVLFLFFVAVPPSECRADEG